MGLQDILQEIDGIDAALAERLTEHGFDTVEKLAGARSEELAGIPGISKKVARSIVAQANRMLDSAQANELSLASLIDDATRMRTQVEQLVRNIRKRFQGEDIPKEHIKALRKETSRTLASLEKVETALSDQLQQFSRSLAKADEKISQLSDCGVEEIVSGLKKARKKIEEATD